VVAVVIVIVLAVIFSDILLYRTILNDIDCKVSRSMVDLEFPDLADDSNETRDPLSVEINLLSII